jgi:beta-glucosidase-like glycosyl hydrolase
VIDERTLREIYLPPFEAAVKLANTAAIMGAFNKVNGDFACESEFLITEVLKRNWSFRGFIESDFAAIHDGLKAALAGMDIEMPGGLTILSGNPFAAGPPGQMTSEKLNPAINSGQLPLSNIDDKVRRLLRGIISFGFLDRPQLDPSIPVNDARSKVAAIEVAREGIVLLENRGDFLPLDKRAIRRIAVIGANAKGEPPSGGGSAAVPPSVDFISEIDGIKSQAPGATIDYIAACVPDPSTAEWQTGQGSAGLVGEYLQRPLVNLLPTSLPVLESSPVPGAKRLGELVSAGQGVRGKAAAPGTPVLTVTDGSGDGQHAAGTIVKVTADEPPARKKFAGWSGDTQILANPAERTTTATMPSIDVTVTATYADDVPSAEQPQ